MKNSIKFGKMKSESITSGIFFSGIIYYIIWFLSSIFSSEIIYSIFIILITAMKLSLLKLAGELVYILIKACNIVTNKKW